MQIVATATSIDRKLEALIQEKGDAAELVLDGALLGEASQEVNLAELLDTAAREFAANPERQTIDETELEREWPRLRCALGQAFLAWDKPQANAEAETPNAEVPTSEFPVPISTVPLWRQWRR